MPLRRQLHLATLRQPVITHTKVSDNVGVRSVRRALVVFFSYTGNTRKVAIKIAKCLEATHIVDLEEIKSTRLHRYYIWLLLSFLPGLGTPIHPIRSDLSHYDIICLGLPKWSLSCPPVNRYIQGAKFLEKPCLGVFITYGGFDEKRFLNSIVRALKNKGAHVSEKLWLKRHIVQEGKYDEDVEAFCRKLVLRSLKKQ
jgi:hypothetical protein